MTATDLDLDPDPELALLHDRRSSVRVFRKNDEELLDRGHARAVKPAGLYVEGDPDPLVLHDMVVDLTVAFPSYEITGAEVVFDTYPQPTCPGISAGYQQLVGLSVTRGFTHRLRELFGGPRGCAHVTALLQAMGPALIQSGWSMRISTRRSARRDGETLAVGDAQTARSDRVGRNVNTCHVWAEDGDLLRRVAAGERVGPG